MKANDGKDDPPAPDNPPPRKRGRPRKDEQRPKPEPTRLERQVTQNLGQMLADLPTACDLGCKKNSKGYKETWTGYKLHIDVANGQIPVSCVLTSASVHDSQVAIPLMTMTSARVSYLYDLMEFGARFLRVRGALKVKCHLMFGIVALAVDQIIRVVNYRTAPA